MYKFITYYSDTFNETPSELIAYLEANKINYLIFPDDTSISEMEGIIQRAHNAAKGVLFLTPEEAPDRLPHFNEDKDNNVMTYFTNFNNEEIGFFHPAQEAITDYSISKMTDIIYYSIVGRNKCKNYGEQVTS